MILSADMKSWDEGRHEPLMCAEKMQMQKHASVADAKSIRQQLEQHGLDATAVAEDSAILVLAADAQELEEAKEQIQVRVTS